ncbi:MAG: flagellar basal body-associated FliL family protein [Alkaliphilus sp.]|nr:flagellar basal body-associated FliL family protein [Alkaliphilus sp.]
MTIKKVFLFSIIGFIIIALIAGGIFYFTVYRKSEPVAEEVITFTYSLGELYSNLKDSNRILKINIVLEITDEKFIENLDSERSKITNHILELLRSKNESQLSGNSGQENLRNEILKLVNSLLPSEKINDVFFVEFITQ